jgi:hypothetical protein
MMIALICQQESNYFCNFFISAILVGVMGNRRVTPSSVSMMMASSGKQVTTW